MPNKTIYVSDNDASLFEEAKNIAGEALSSVIVRALREFVARQSEKQKGMKEISVKVGSAKTSREQRFIGSELGKWSGLSDDKEWWMESKIYRTQKGKLAILLIVVCKASLLINPLQWHISGDYLTHTKRSELLVTDDIKTLQKKLPTALFTLLTDFVQKEENPVEYLDI